MKPILDGRWSSAWLLITAVVLALNAVRAADSVDLIPEDTCFIDLTLPEGAKVTVDGKDHGTNRRLTFRSLARGHIDSAQLTVQFPSGQRETHMLLIQGGRRVTLAALDPASTLPEPIVATQFEGLRANITNLSFSKDGQRLLTGLSNGVAALCDYPNRRLLRVFGEPVIDPCPFEAYALAPDSRFVCSLPKSRNPIILWDAVSGQRLRSFEGHTGEVFSIAFSPNGRHLLSGAKDKTAILWDAATGQKLRTFEGHTDVVSSVAFSPVGRQVLIGSWDKTADLWDAATGQKLRTLEGHTDVVNSVAFSPDGRQVFTGSWDKTAILWDAATGQKLRTLEGYAGRFNSAAFSPDGGMVLAGSILWDPATGRSLRTFGGARITDGIDSGAFSPDGRMVLAPCGRPGHINVIFGGNSQEVNFFGFSGYSYINDGSFSPDGWRVLTGLSDRMAILWDAATGRELRTFEGHTAAVHSVAFSPDGRQVLTGSWDRTAILWDAATGQKLRTFEGHTASVNFVVFSPDGRRVLTGADDKTAVLWDAATGQKLRTFEGHTNGVGSVAFSPDGQRVLTGADDKTAVLWDTATGQKLRTFKGHTHSVRSVVFNPDGRQVLTGSDDSTAILWDTATGQKLRTLVGHAGRINSAAFSPDGRQAITVSSDETAILWDATTGQKLRSFRGQFRYLNHAVLCARAELLACFASSGLLLFDVCTGKELASVQVLDVSDWLVVTPEGLFDGSQGAMRKIAYRIGKGLNVVPVDRFYKDFYRPGLLAAILRGDRPLPDIEIGKQLPPKLRIVSPDPGTVDQRNVTVVAEATDEGGGVAGLDLYQNGSRLVIDSKTTAEGTTTRRSFPVSLVEGDNVIEVRATCQDGSWESEPARVQLRYEKAVPGAELYLVTAGINRYADEALNLRFAAADAKALAELFQQRGAALYGQGKVHVYTLLDEQATKAALKKTLAEVAQKAQTQDALVLALSGHGTMLGSLYYFVPHEVQCRSGKPVEDEIREQGLPQYQLKDWMSSVPALKRVLILDTCQSGGAVGLGRTGRSPWQFKKAMESMSRSEGSYIIAAAAASDEAQEVPELGHGILTYTLLAGAGAMDAGPLGRRPLKPAGDDNLLTIRQWLGYAQDKVPTLTKLYFDQKQFVEAEIHGQDFPILPLEKP